MVFLVQVFRLFRLEPILLVFRESVDTVGREDVQHLIYWQGQHVCDALFSPFSHAIVPLRPLWASPRSHVGLYVK